MDNASDGLQLRTGKPETINRYICYHLLVMKLGRVNEGWMMKVALGHIQYMLWFSKRNLGNQKKCTGLINNRDRN